MQDQIQLSALRLPAEVTAPTEMGHDIRSPTAEPCPGRAKSAGMQSGLLITEWWPLQCYSAVIYSL